MPLLNDGTAPVPASAGPAVTADGLDLITAFIEYAGAVALAAVDTDDEAAALRQARAVAESLLAVVLVEVERDLAHAVAAARAASLAAD